MKCFFVSLFLLASLAVFAHADRVASTFDPSAAGLTLKFDTNTVLTDNFYSPSIVFSPDGKKAFVNFPGSDSVEVFNAETMEPIATLAVGKNPASLSLTPDGKTIAVVNTHLADKLTASQNLGSISFIDVETLAVRTVTPVKVDFSLGSNMVFTPDGKSGFVASTGSDEILRLNIPEGTEAARLKLPTGTRPVSLTMAHDGSFFTSVNVSDQQFSTTKDSISIIEVSGFKLRASVAPTEVHDFLGTHRVALTLDDSKGIVSDDGNKGLLSVDVVYIFDTKTGSVLKRLPVGIDTFDSALVPDGSRFVVVSSFGISFISTESLEIVKEVVPPGASFTSGTNIVFSSDSKTAYIASPSNDLFFRIDLDSYAVVGQVNVGKNKETFEDTPFQVALTPDEQRVAVLNFGSNTVDFVVRTFLFAIPRFYADANRFTGLTLVNVGPKPMNLRLEALSLGGVPFADDKQTTDRVEVVNPIDVDLPPGQQLAGLASDIFQNNPSTDAEEGWVLIDSTQKELVGFFQIGDNSGKKLDGASLTSKGQLVSLLPVVRQNDKRTTELMILNFSFNGATATVELYDNEGTLVRSTDIQLPGSGLASRILQSSAGTNDLFPEALNLDGAYLIIKGSLPLSVLGVYDTAETLSVLPAMAIPASDPAGVKLVAPEVAVSGGFKTVVSLVNQSGGDAEFTFTLLNNAGEPIVDSKTITIGDKKSANLDLAELFALTGDVPLSGWLRVVSSNAGILGAVEVSGFDERAASASPLTATSGTDFHLPYIAQGDGFGTGIVLVNPGDVAANVKIDVLDSAGVQIGITKDVTLAPNSRLSELVSTLLGLVSQVGGRLRVRSDVPIVGLEIFYDSQAPSLSVIQPQSVQP
ncbi:MAG TPA: hypothetical protein VGK99_19410 [Acidobacteriota bacterium]|jgi:DNA-binding beta-propeller fold protein YncE